MRRRAAVLFPRRRIWSQEVQTNEKAAYLHGGKRAVNGYLFILPWLLGFLLFYVRSLYMTVEFS